MSTTRHTVTLTVPEYQAVRFAAEVLRARGDDLDDTSAAIAGRYRAEASRLDDIANRHHRARAASDTASHNGCGYCKAVAS